MACNLEPQCNFLYGYFTCNLPEGTIDMDVTVCTLKGIHTFTKDHNTQMSTCSLWGTPVRPFPSLRRKMKDYTEECQAFINPFAVNRENPNRPNPSPFAKKPKTIPTKRSHMETKCDIKKLCKPRKAHKGHSKMCQYNEFVQAKTVETMPQNPAVIQPVQLVAIPIQQAATQLLMHSQLQFPQWHLPSQW